MLSILLYMKDLGRRLVPGKASHPRQLGNDRSFAHAHVRAVLYHSDLER
jgi:hypothetical protein